MRACFEKHPTLIPGRQRLSLFIASSCFAWFDAACRVAHAQAGGDSLCSPLGIDLDAGWLMAVLLASLVCTGTDALDALIRAHRK